MFKFYSPSDFILLHLTFLSFIGLDQNFAGGTILLYFLQFASHSMCGTENPYYNTAIYKVRKLHS